MQLSHLFSLVGEQRRSESLLSYYTILKQNKLILQKVVLSFKISVYLSFFTPDIFDILYNTFCRHWINATVLKDGYLKIPDKFLKWIFVLQVTFLVSDSHFVAHRKSTIAGKMVNVI